jgi:hypothetical protein
MLSSSWARLLLQEAPQNISPAPVAKSTGHSMCAKNESPPRAGFVLNVALAFMPAAIVTDRYLIRSGMTISLLFLCALCVLGGECLGSGYRTPWFRFITGAGFDFSFLGVGSPA